MSGLYHIPSIFVMTGPRTSKNIFINIIYIYIYTCIYIYIYSCSKIIVACVESTTIVVTIFGRIPDIIDWKSLLEPRLRKNTWLEQFQQA